MTAMATPDTPTLLARISVQADQESWEHIVERYHQVMFWTAKVILGVDSDAEDVVQDSLLLIRQNARRFVLRPGDDREEQARRWLLRITANCAISWRRREQVRRARSAPAQHLEAVPAPQADASGEGPPGLGQLNLALAELDEIQRRPIILHYFLGLDVSSLAGELGCSAVAARKRLSRSMAQLRKSLERTAVASPGLIPLGLDPAAAFDGVHAALSIASPAGPSPSAIAGWKSLATASLQPSTAASVVLGTATTVSGAIAAICIGLIGIGAALAVATAAFPGPRNDQPPAPKAVAESDAIPVVQPPAAEVPTVARPPWAADFGTDRHGTWADLAIGSDKQRFRYVFPGTFRMGSPRGELGRIDAVEALHTVVLSAGFWLGNTEVTQGVWREITGKNPSKFQGATTLDSAGKMQPVQPAIPWEQIRQHPVEQVSWLDCQQFFKRLAEKYPAAAQVTFPTEAQWEYACRAGNPGAFGVNDPLVLFGSESMPHAVKSGVPNRWGFFDMHGNVDEWCSDWISPYPIGKVVDPTGPVWIRRVNRGGTFASESQDCQSARRMQNRPEDRMWYLGVRLCIPDPLPPLKGIEALDQAHADRNPVWAVEEVRRLDPTLATAMDLAERGQSEALVQWIAKAGIRARSVLGRVLTTPIQAPADAAAKARRTTLTDGFLAGCPREESAWILVANQVADAIVAGGTPPSPAGLARAADLATHLLAAVDDCQTDVDWLLDTVACVRFRQGDRPGAIAFWKRAAAAAEVIERKQTAALIRKRLAGAERGLAAADVLATPVPDQKAADESVAF